MLDVEQKAASLKTLTFTPTKKSLLLATKYGYDEWIVNRFLQFIPDAEKLIEKMQGPVQKYIRTNKLKITSQDLKERLISKGYELRDTILTDVFEVSSNNSCLSIGATTEYLLGYYYIQDITSCIAVEALDVRRDQVVLDMASAPGGKTTLIAQKMNNTGSIIAFEPNPRRIKSLSFNITRCGVVNTLIYQLEATKALDLNSTFDRILLDAPCTGEGVIWKDPARKTSRTPADITECSIVQEKLFEVAFKILKPGGLIVYSTCSFAPEENECVVNSVLDNYDVDIEPIPFGIEGLTNFGGLVFHEKLRSSARFYPHIHNSTGFYIARLRKNN
jgi:tRNA (cytosine40_48-C5)-methyltransferase